MCGKAGLHNMMGWRHRWINRYTGSNELKKTNSTYIKARIQNAGLCCLFTSLRVHFISLCVL